MSNSTPSEPLGPLDPLTRLDGCDLRALLLTERQRVTQLSIEMHSAMETVSMLERALGLHRHAHHHTNTERGRLL